MLDGDMTWMRENKSCKEKAAKDVVETKRKA